MEHIGYFFKRIDNRLKSNADAELGKHGLTFAQSRIIRFLAERGGQTTQKEIEDYAHVSHPTIVGIVTRMEQSGFLSTCTDPSDKRNKVVRLTDRLITASGRCSNRSAKKKSNSSADIS